MALELFGGAVLGAFVGELLKSVLDARQKASGFQPSLARLESTLKVMIQRLDQIRHLNNQLDIRQSEMEELISIINNGKELVVKCSKISTINLVGKVRYSKELIDLDNSLLRYFMTTLSLDNFKVSKEILVAVTRLEVKLVGDDHKDRGVFKSSGTLKAPGAINLLQIDSKQKSQASDAKITPGTSKLAHVAQRTLQPPIIFLEKSSYRELSEIAEQAKRLAEVARLRELLTLKGRVESVLKLKRLDIGIMEQQYYYSI